MNSTDFYNATRDRLNWMLYNNRFKQKWIVNTQGYNREWHELHTENSIILDCMEEIAELYFASLRTDA